MSNQEATPTPTIPKEEQAPTRAISKEEAAPSPTISKEEEAPTRAISKEEEAPTPTILKKEEAPIPAISKAEEAPTRAILKEKEAPTPTVLKDEEAPNGKSKEEEAPTYNTSNLKKNLMIAVDDGECSRYALEWALDNLPDYISQSSTVYLITAKQADIGYVYAASIGSAPPNLTKTIQERQEKDSIGLLEKVNEICLSRGGQHATKFDPPLNDSLMLLSNVQLYYSSWGHI